MARPAPARRQPSIHPLLPALIAVIVFGVLVLVVANTSGDDGTPAATPTTTASTTSTTVPEPTTTTLPAPVEVGPLLVAPPAEDPPTSYRIAYDVVENGLARTEVVSVRRPYESLVISERDGAVLSGSSTSRTKLRTYLADRAGWLTLQPELHRAAYDQRPLRSVAALEALGYVEELGQDTVASRPCTVYRTGAPLSSTDPSKPSDSEDTEFCLDDAGLVLHELWRLDGQSVIERTATSVEIDVDFDPAIFDPTPPIEDDEEFGAMFSTIAVPADEETLARLRTVVPADGPLAGYTADGAVFRAGNPAQGGTSSTETVRFYSSGAELLEVAEHYFDREAFLGGGSAVRVEVEGWDEVWVVPGFRNSAVRARLDEYSYLELRHADIGFLFDVLQAIERIEA